MRTTPVLRHVRRVRLRGLVDFIRLHMASFGPALGSESASWNLWKVGLEGEADTTAIDFSDLT